MKNKYTQALKKGSGILLVLIMSMMPFQANGSDLAKDESESRRIKSAHLHNKYALKYGFHDHLIDIEAIKESEKKPKQDGVVTVFARKATELRQFCESEDAKINKGLALGKQALKDKIIEDEIKLETKEGIFEYFFNFLHA